jgi:hypothetical protein
MQFSLHGLENARIAVERSLAVCAARDDSAFSQQFTVQDFGRRRTRTEARNVCTTSPR